MTASLGVTVLFAISSILLAVIGFMLWRQVFGLFGRLGTWGILAKSYSTDASPRTEWRHAQSAVLGMNNYRNAINICVDQQGVFLDMPRIAKAGYPRLLIPWADVRSAEEWRFGGFARRWIRLEVGTPAVPIMLPPGVFQGEGQKALLSAVKSRP
jgi:hypothetical protein